MTRTTAIILFVLAIGILAICAGVTPPAELVFLLAVGWIFFLYDTIPQMQPNLGEVGVAASAITLFTIGAHAGLRWLATSTSDENKSKRWPLRYSMMIVALVMLMFISGTAMIGLVHQTTWLATMDGKMMQSGMREAAYRNGSLSNVRQLGIGAANMEGATHSFPSGCTTDERGHLLHGWMTQLLPFVEEELLYEKIDRHRAWDGETNAEIFRQQIPSFRNPGVEGDQEDPRGFAASHYAANALAIGGDRRRTSDDFSDGVANTILFGEAAGNYKAWGSPTNWRDPTLGLGRSPDGFGGPWSDGQTIVAFGDGHSRILNNEIDPQVLRALSTPSGGESVDMNALD